METKFEAAFLKAVKKHASIKKLVKKKVDMIIENPIAIGEPLKGNWQGFYSCPVKRNFIIIYLYCEVCGKKTTMPLWLARIAGKHRTKPSSSFC